MHPEMNIFTGWMTVLLNYIAIMLENNPNQLELLLRSNFKCSESSNLSEIRYYSSGLLLGQVPDC